MAFNDKTGKDKGAPRTRTVRAHTRSGARARSRARERAANQGIAADASTTGSIPPIPDEGPDGLDAQDFSVTSIGTVRRAARREKAKQQSRRVLMGAAIALGVVAVLVFGWFALYNSSAFTIETINVTGVEHLTSNDMAQMIDVPEGTTLLRVDTDVIRQRLLKNAWVKDVEVKRAFPSTLEVNVTEREITAIVEVPSGRSGSTVKSWAIASDHVWLMPIPEVGSEAAKTTSLRIYEDAEKALHITDVPYGTKAEIGTVCVDDNVNNALDIVAGMTTDLAGHVTKVSAAGPAETTLVLDSGIEIAFGKAENVRDKERVILKIMEENPDGVAYINVRIVDSPTWRAI